MVWTMLLDPGKFTITLFWNSAMEKTSVFHNVFQCFRILENVLVTEKESKVSSDRRAFRKSTPG